MIGTLMNIIVLLMTLFVYLLTWSNDALAAMLIIAGIFTIGNFAVICTCLKEQVVDIESVKEHQGKKPIYELQREELITHAVTYLGEKYPEHEKEIFKYITEQNSNAVVNLLGSLPEIKSAGVLRDLVGKIQTLNKNVYAQDLSIEELRKKIRVRSRDYWTPRFLIPKEEA